MLDVENEHEDEELSFDVVEKLVVQLDEGEEQELSGKDVEEGEEEEQIGTARY